MIRKSISFLIICLLPALQGKEVFAQSLNQVLLKATFDSHKSHTVRRHFLKFKRKINYINPLAYAGAGMMYVYQNLVSEQIQATCMYQTSCSEFTKLAIQERGFITGVLIGFNQLSECHPGALYEHPGVFINGRKINNRVDKASK